MSVTDQLCLIGERSHQADPGLLLCHHHFDQLARLLHDVEEEAITLDIRPPLAVSYDSAGGGALASQRSPVRLEALVLTDRRRGTGVTAGRDLDEHGWDDTPSVVETLHAWARMVREERQLAQPDRITVISERRLLTAQLDWIARQPWVDDMHTELRDLVSQLKRVNGTTIVPVGDCDSLQADGSLCDGKVWHVVIGDDGKVTKSGDGEPGFRCGRCRRVWTGTDAVRKRDQMWRDEHIPKAEEAS